MVGKFRGSKGELCPDDFEFSKRRFAKCDATSRSRCRDLLAPPARHIQALGLSNSLFVGCRSTHCVRAKPGFQARAKVDFIL